MGKRVQFTNFGNTVECILGAENGDAYAPDLKADIQAYWIKFTLEEALILQYRIRSFKVKMIPYGSAVMPAYSNTSISSHLDLATCDWTVDEISYTVPPSLEITSTRATWLFEDNCVCEPSDVEGECSAVTGNYSWTEIEADENDELKLICTTGLDFETGIAFGFFGEVYNDCEISAPINDIAPFKGIESNQITTQIATSSYTCEDDGYPYCGYGQNYSAAVHLGLGEISSEVLLSGFPFCYFSDDSGYVYINTIDMFNISIGFISQRADNILCSDEESSDQFTYLSLNTVNYYGAVAGTLITTDIDFYFPDPIGHVTKTCYLHLYTTGNGDIPDIGVTNIEVTFPSYYEYKNLDGFPVYDSETGAKINENT